VPDRLVIDRVSRCYPGQPPDQAALRDVHLAVDGGRFVTLMGPSGCGKSTLLRLLAGLDEPDQGAVTLFGGSPDAVRRAKAIGLVAQRPALMPWLSVLDNVTLLQRVNRPRHAGAGPDAAEILAAVGLGDVLHRKPHELSGGMQQRVAIARAFALTPRLLLMDEPFAALDEFTREALQVQLLALWERWRTTVVFVTHSIREAVLLGDTVVVMAARPGRILSTQVIDLPRPRGAELIGSAAVAAYEDGLRRSWKHSA
jgi:NitT/TauT family transport system ATP-binding protein